MELQAVGNVITRVKGSKGIIDISHLISLCILLDRLVVTLSRLLGLRLYIEPPL